MRGPSRQNGFTLIEIMIALVIGLILMAALIQLFIGNRESYRVQSGMATVQETGRFAMNIVRDNLSMAGFPDVAPFINTTEGGGANSDAFTLQYVTATDCLGNAAVNASAATAMTFSIGTQANVAQINRNRGLLCAPAGGVATLLAGGIDNMQVLYGEDLDGDGLANRYVGTPTVADLRKIRSVRIALLVNSIEPVDRINTTVNYQLLSAAPITFTDNISRRVFTSTVLIRN